MKKDEVHDLEWYLRRYNTSFRYLCVMLTIVVLIDLSERFL